VNEPVDVEALARRIILGLQRNQVVIGKDKLRSMARRKQVGLVWATTDLSRRALGKLQVECEAFDLPLLLAGDSEEVAVITGRSGTKVYLVKRSCSGLRQLLKDLEPALNADGDGA
jgi:hypothetical protein